MATKGQAAIMDALIFMLIAAGAASLLLYISGLYNSSTNSQVISIYNYEYAGNALISLHYARDSDDHWVWLELKKKLAMSSPESEVIDYLDTTDIKAHITRSSPTSCTFLNFRRESTGEEIYYPESCDKATATFTPDELKDRPVYTSSVHTRDSMGDVWTVILKLYY